MPNTSEAICAGSSGETGCSGSSGTSGKAALTATSLSVPILQGQLALGTWQGIYVWEHRTGGYRREVVVHVLGE